MSTFIDIDAQIATREAKEKEDRAAQAKKNRQEALAKAREAKKNKVTGFIDKQKDAVAPIMTQHDASAWMSIYTVLLRNYEVKTIDSAKTVRLLTDKVYQDLVDNKKV